jgi:bacterioferritin-associated ferredoxin
MVVDYSYSESESLISIPYEFTPLPEVGENVPAMDREGKDVCCARVVRILNTKNTDKTPVVSLAVPKEFVYDVRHFRKSQEPRAKNQEKEITAEDDVSMICRCNDITVEKLHELIANGFTSVDEIKRVSRLGMGPCQGRNCIPLVMTELARATGRNVSELSPGTYRPVTRSITLGAVADYEKVETR